MHNYDFTLEDAIEADTNLIGSCETCGKPVLDSEPHKTVCDFWKDRNGKKYPRDLHYHRNGLCEVGVDVSEEMSAHAEF